MSENIPTLKAYVYSQPNTVVVWCRHCATWHHHGNRNDLKKGNLGLLEAHCSLKSGSLLLATGYCLHIVGPYAALSAAEMRGGPISGSAYKTDAELASEFDDDSDAGMEDMSNEARTERVSEAEKNASEEEPTDVEITPIPERLDDPTIIGGASSAGEGMGG